MHFGSSIHCARVAWQAPPFSRMAGIAATRSAEPREMQGWSEDNVRVYVEGVAGTSIHILARDTTVFQLRTLVAASLRVYPLQVGLSLVGLDGSTTELLREDFLLRTLIGKSASCTVAACAHAIDAVTKAILEAMQTSALSGSAQRIAMECGLSLLRPTLTADMMRNPEHKRRVTAVMEAVMKRALLIDAGRLHAEDVRRWNDRGFEAHIGDAPTHARRLQRVKIPVSWLRVNKSVPEKSRGPLCTVYLLEDCRHAHTRDGW